MNIVKRIYYFLGSIYLAITLIGLTATLVIIGTFIEASTQSHKSASLLTYSTPWFIALLCGFFINILVSALRRWPFCQHHIPFLITHLGLLMIISGVMIKTLFGVQGTLIIEEGSGSHDLFVDNVEALRVEHKDPDKEVAYIPVHANQKLLTSSISVVDHVANSEELLIPWSWGKNVYLRGLDPIPIQVFTSKLPPPFLVNFHSESPTQLWALQTSQPVECIQKIMKTYGQIKILDTLTGKTLAQYPLEQMLAESVPVKFDDDKKIVLNTSLDLGNHEQFGIQSPHIYITLMSPTCEHLVAIPLDGPRSLFNENITTPYLGQLPLTFDIVIPNFLAILLHPNHNSMVIGSDSHGSVCSSFDDAKKLSRLFAYDDGYAGYTMQKEILLIGLSRIEKEQLIHQELVNILLETQQKDMEMAPPLLLFQQACNKIEIPFTEMFVTFLEEWNQHHSWLYPQDQQVSTQLQPIFDAMMDIWEAKQQEAASLASFLFHRYDFFLEQGIDPLRMLKQENWPLIEVLEESHPKNATEVLTLLTQQIFQAADFIPDALVSNGEKNLPRMFSAYLRAYGIHLHDMIPDIEIKNEPIVLETIVHREYIKKEPESKMEDNIPAITVAMQDPKGVELVPLVYNKKGAGLCWPTSKGNCLLRYQPMVQKIPYHLRLWKARQINYPNSAQVYSYEADIEVKDLRTNTIVNTTISMNHVHETSDGYRFYLSAMYPQDEGAVKTVQIVANKDPTKYLLTYPGALIVSCGIIGLFWMRPYRKQK